MSAIKHRPEIDGLRAVAVIPVVLYHAAVGFTGGYVGVDVFFVISGYLITSLILAELEGGTFSILNFWERRVRRILPALAVVALACVVAGWIVLMPADFKVFGQSLAFQSVFLGNVFFRRAADYFTSNDTQPLLHTWSLAVEEQFYILFPLLLVVLSLFGRRALIWTIGLAALASLGLSIHGSYADPNSAFYLLPYRAWELFLGALLAALPERHVPIKWLNECLSWAGLIGILAAALTFDSKTRFPGVAALLPCLGAALVIATNAPGRSLAGRLLSLRPVVFIGLISYSLYLWHWPVLIFSKYWSPTPLSQADLVGGVAASLLLATLSWKFVETPFRRRLVLRTRPRAFVFAGCTLATLFMAGRLIRHEEGFRSRFGPEVLRFLEGRNDRDFDIQLDLSSARSGQLTPIGNKDADRPIGLLLWGDSHAMMLLHVLDVACREANVRAVAATHPSTPPLLNFPDTLPYSLKGDTIAYNQAIFDFARKHRVGSVLLAGAWRAYVPAGASQEVRDRFSRALAETLDALHGAGVMVYILRDVPSQPFAFDVPQVLAVATARGIDPTKLGVRESDYRAQNADINGILDRAAGTSAVVLDPAPFLADKTGLCRIERNGRALYVDLGHLSVYGEMQLRPLFDGMLSAGAQVPAR